MFPALSHILKEDTVSKFHMPPQPKSSKGIPFVAMLVVIIIAALMFRSIINRSDANAANTKADSAQTKVLSPDTGKKK